MRVRLFGFCVAAVLWSSGLLSAQSSPPSATMGLSEAQQLKIQNLELRAQLVQARGQLAVCQAQVLPQTVTEEKAALEKEFRDAVKPPADWIFNWSATPPRFEAPPK